MVKLKIKIGLKGQILIPKVFREKYGLNDGASVTMEPLHEGILLKRRPWKEEILGYMREHVAKVRSHGVVGPKMGDLKKYYMEG